MIALRETELESEAYMLPTSTASSRVEYVVGSHPDREPDPDAIGRAPENPEPEPRGVICDDPNSLCDRDALAE